MKKIIIALVMFAGISSANAQAFGDGTSVIEAGVGFGGTFGMPIALGFEYGISEKIGIGLTAAYASKTEAFAGFGDVKYTYMLVGLKGNYHFYTTDVIDVYGGIILGYNSAKATYPQNMGLFQPSVASGAVYGGQIGGRYYFTDSIGAFAELGYGIANFNVGLVFKF